MPKSTYRVFISYTGTDLSQHAEVVAAVLRKLQVVAVDHRDAGATGQPSVAWCRDAVAGCDIVVVLVAYRYGWVPTVAEGGDDTSSITWLEVQHARGLGKPVLAYLVQQGAFWNPEWIEGLHDDAVKAPLASFKRELSASVAGYFTEEADSLDGPVSRNVATAISDVERRTAAPSTGKPATVGGDAESPVQVRPWIYSRDVPPSVGDRLVGSQPKRVLCLDSAGPETALQLAWLERLERLLQARYGEPDFCLADYFDLIAGSGIGAILATQLARGNSVADSAHVVHECVHAALSRRRPLWASISMGPIYDPGPMARALQTCFPMSWSSAGWTTGVILVATQLECGLPCHFSNHPSEAADWLASSPVHRLLLGCNSQLSYFPALVVPGPEGRSMALSAADIVGAGNPALYVLSQLANPPWRWQLSQYQLHIVSVGGLMRRQSKQAEDVAEANLLQQVGLLVDAMMLSASQASRQVLSAFAGARGLALGFQRLELTADDAVLTSHNGLPQDFSDKPWKDRLAYWDTLLKIGREAAGVRLGGDALTPAFDVRLIPQVPAAT